MFEAGVTTARNCKMTKGEFPPSKPDWSNIEVIHRNTLEPRSHFLLYDNAEAALDNDVNAACVLELSGKWKFNHSHSPFSAPSGFQDPEYDTSSWPDINVPGHWQLQGWGHPQYINISYPFFVDPPNAPHNNNQTGCYVREFYVAEKHLDSQLRLRFEGVDSAFHVYINGKEVGYSQGARNPSEFDIKPFVRAAGMNKIAVKVYQYCDGSYLESQDQWRFSGIFRDVNIHIFPQVHVKDFHVQTMLDDAYTDAKLDVRVDLSEETDLPVEMVLRTSNGEIVAKASVVAKETINAHHVFEVNDPAKWTAEEPNLYKLLISFDGRHIAQNVGFRRIDISDGIYKVNGQRIVFRGVNRHEHHPEHGRAVPYEFMKRDLMIMKQHNINAIRTCHQPSDPRLYALADELGLWVLDEADLECHGFATIGELALTAEDRAKSYQERTDIISESAGEWTSNNPAWKEQYVDRARQLVARDKNHPCIVIWSLGNEAFYGSNFQHMYDYIKSIDPTRPVHYEGDRNAKSADLFSQMYTSVEDIIEFAKEPNFTKPLVLCEFIHAMGCGPGNIEEYIDAFYRYPRLQGGWVWEWANHGLRTRDKATGAEYYAYGGDFSDVPNDYNFVMDGMLFSDHTPGPGLIEYAKAIEPVQFLSYSQGKATIVNRYDTINLDHILCYAKLIADGVSKDVGDIKVPKSIGPHTEAMLDIPDFELGSIEGDAYLQLEFRILKATAWNSAGHVVSLGQVKVKHADEIRPVSNTGAKLIAGQEGHQLHVHGEHVSWMIDLSLGMFVSWKKDGSELICDGKGFDLNFYRAMTDNDRPQDGKDWLEKRVDMASTQMRHVSWKATESSGCVVLEVTANVAPVTLSWYVTTTTIYTMHSSGRLSIDCEGRPGGLNLPATLPRIGMTFAMPAEYDEVSWFGRGPGQSYTDMKLSQLFGNWSDRVDNLYVDYEFPQESSNRTDVRWVRISAGGTSDSSRKGWMQLPVLSALTNAKQNDAIPALTARFGTQDGFSFMISHYETQDIDESTHPFELNSKKKEYVVVRLDANHHGLGTGSCGPKTMDKYALKTDKFKFSIVLE